MDKYCKLFLSFQYSKYPRPTYKNRADQHTRFIGICYRMCLAQVQENELEFYLFSETIFISSLQTMDGEPFTVFCFSWLQFEFCCLPTRFKVSINFNQQLHRSYRWSEIHFQDTSVPREISICLDNLTEDQTFEDPPIMFRNYTS